MQPLASIALSSAFWAVVLIASLPSQTPDLPVDNFVHQYVAAWNAKDAARLRSLYTAQSRACVTSGDNDFYNQILALEMKESIPATYTFSLQPVNQQNLQALSSTMNLPVPPERELHIDYQQNNDLGGLVIWLVRDNGRWQADYPCATPQAVKEFHDSAPAREHMNQLAAGIKDPLRSELITALRQHDTPRAIDRYHQATGRDMQTSMAVINALKLSLQ